MKYNVKANTITLANNYSLNFEYPIKETLMIDNVIVILLNIPKDKKYNKNVFAINKNGDFLWRIAEVKLNYSSNDCPYTGIAFINNELKLFNWCDTTVIVDPTTGEIICTHQAK